MIGAIEGRAEGPVRDEAYPVVEERVLTYLPRRFLVGARRRELSDLPEVRPGTILVFKQGGRFVAVTDAMPLSGREEAVVDATAVSLVNLRPRLFTVYLQLPSQSAGYDFAVRVSFIARVADAERAAAEGPVEMTSYLASYLGRRAAREARRHALGGRYRQAS